MGNGQELPKHILICVTFFYIEERLRYLRTISSYFSQLGETVSVYIVTNVDDPESKRKIEEAIGGQGFPYQVVCPALLGHPFLLTWSHMAILRDQVSNEAITHFLYLEDDICIKPNNIAYWMRGREALRAYNLIPSFFRFEYKDGDDRPYSTDVSQTVNLHAIPKVVISSSYAYLNLPQPYQGMYLLDRELIREHLAGKSSNPDFGGWNIREKAAQGITFLNVPNGFSSRNLIGYNVAEGCIDPHCLVHHTANSYANNPHSSYGKIPIKDVISASRLFIPAGLRKFLKEWVPSGAIRLIEIFTDALKATGRAISRD